MTMRSLPASLLAAGVCVLPLATLHAQQAPPMDPKAVLATLKDLRAKQAGIITKEKADVLAAIRAAMADPGKAYEQAMAATEQSGPGGNEPPGHPGNRPPSEAREVAHAAEMRKRQNDLLRDRTFVNGLRLQLAYLGLTWQHGMGAKTKDLIPALLDYTNQVNANSEALSTLEMFKKPLSDSVFVAYFQVGPYIAGLADWSDRLFDTDSIFQKTILPEMRKNKDPRLLDYWDTRLQAETARASASQNNLIVSKFNHIRRPALLWSRAEDVMALGNTDRAAVDMLALIKANPDHPDFDKWATELEGIASAKAEPPAGDVTVGPATAASPAPPGATTNVAR